MSKLGKIFNALRAAGSYAMGQGPRSSKRVTYLDGYKDYRLDIAPDTRTTYALSGYGKLNGDVGLRLVVEGNGFESSFAESCSPMGTAFYVANTEIPLGIKSKEDTTRLIADFEDGKYLFELLPDAAENSALVKAIACHEIFKGFCLENDPSMLTRRPVDPLAYMQSLQGEGNKPVPLCHFDPRLV